LRLEKKRGTGDGRTRPSHTNFAVQTPGLDTRSDLDTGINSSYHSTWDRESLPM
jgi:hypothetical protein